MNAGLADIYSFHKNIHLQIHDWHSRMKAEVAVFDMLGKRIYQSQINRANEVIDLQSQPGGIYIIEVKMENSITRKKVYLQD